MLLNLYWIPFFLSLLGYSPQPVAVVTGAEQVDFYLPLLEGKRVALVANATSTIGKTHLLDVLLANKVNVLKVFAPEHGFRGDTEAGGKVDDEKDDKTGVPLISLYGNNKKPTSQQLSEVDIVVFDIQDVGVRFYTYLSTLHYVMEACAEQGKPLLVLDRPNPHGAAVDGPVMQKKFSSFVGLHPVPILYGLTIGEYAKMIQGEEWISKAKDLQLTVVPLQRWTHNTRYELPVVPSPNLPNMKSIYLYPSLALFEGTDVSIGRGTPEPFQVVGAPWFSEGSYTFTPTAIPGKSVNPKHEGILCYGQHLGAFAEHYMADYDSLYLFWLQALYKAAPNKKSFFNSFFDKLAGSDQLRKQVIAGASEEEIRKSWKADLEAYLQVRKKYLSYP